MTDQIIGVPKRPLIGVVIATYNRPESLVDLLRQLADQTLPLEQYQVIVVDDGSAPPVAPRLANLAFGYELIVLAQANAGQAAARHQAILRTTGELVVILDDDMRIARSFLAEHLSAHAAGTRRVVLGALRAEDGEPLPLFERWHLAQTAKREREVRAGRMRLRGTHLYTGNVSFRPSDYFQIGGFDPSFRLSEDAELGVRLERAGVELALGGGASWHASDHTSLSGWMRRSRAYGAADSRVAEKHAGVAWADPWRFVFSMHPATRLPLVVSALAPRTTRPLAWLAMYVSLGLASVGAERVALTGTTLVYGMQYFAGVGDHAGSLRRTLAGFLRYARSQRDASSPKLRETSPG